MTRTESDKYCRNGDREGFLYKSACEKALKGLPLSDEESEVLISENRKIMESLGVKHEPF